MNISSPTYADSALSGYIDYPIKRRIAHIDPRLDSYWKHNLTKLFEELNPQQREDVASQLLESKQIAWDRKNNTFSFTGRPVEFHTYIQSIDFPQLRQLAFRVNDHFELLKQQNDVLEISDLLENTLAVIDRINLGDDPELLAAKHKMRAEFRGCTR